MLRRRFLFNKVVEKPYVYKYTTTDGYMLDLPGVKNHKYENGIGSFETNKVVCVKFNYEGTLESIIIPEGVNSIRPENFYECNSLTNIIIPNSVTSIGDEAFWGCTGLTSVTIPNSVTSIGYAAFCNCKGLTSIEIPNSVTSIGDEAFWGCSSLTSVVVANGNTVYDSRDNCNAIIETATNTLIVGCQNTTIPNSVTSIEGDAF